MHKKDKKGVELKSGDRVSFLVGRATKPYTGVITGTADPYFVVKKDTAFGGSEIKVRAATMTKL